MLMAATALAHSTSRQIAPQAPGWWDRARATLQSRGVLMSGHEHKLAPVALFPKGQPAHHLLAAGADLDSRGMGIGLDRVVDRHVDVLALPACIPAAVLSRQLAMQCSDLDLLLERAVSVSRYQHSSPSTALYVSELEQPCFGRLQHEPAALQLHSSNRAMQVTLSTGCPEGRGAKSRLA